MEALQGKFSRKEKTVFSYANEEGGVAFNGGNYLCMQSMAQHLFG